MTSLNPVFTVGRQIGEVLREHLGMSRREARARTIELLDLVHIPAPERRVDEYPHQLSGGMRQRVMIAMALACDPKILIADEPTTALDVTMQAGILDLMREIRERLGTAIVLITHDLGVVADIADRVLVMYAGRKAEEAPVRRALRPAAAPVHDRPARRDPAAGGADGSGRLREIPGRVPSLRELPDGCAFATALPARPTSCAAQRAGARAPVGAGPPGRLLPPGEPECTSDERAPVARGRRPRQALPRRRRHRRRRRRRARGRRRLVRARPGEMLGLVGESGQRQVDGRATASCGSSNRPRARSALADATSRTCRDARCGRCRRELHIVFQDPYSSLNPRMTVRADRRRAAAPAPARPRQGARRARRELFDHCRPPARASLPLPARALGRPAPARRARPRAHPSSRSVLVADEPVSALDVSVQASILNLLRDLQRDLRLLVPLHHARSGDGGVPLRPRRGDVPRQDRRDGADAELFARRSTRTRRPCSPLRSCPIPVRAAPAPARSCSRATSRARSTRRPAAASARAARWRPSRRRAPSRRSRSCASSRRHLVACHLVARWRGADLASRLRVSFTTRPELRGTFGMVASTHWLASAAGMAVLERGGNAFDAAVATGFTLQVVEPHLNGPGGEVPALLWPVAKGEPIALCGQGVAPSAATIDRYRELGHELVPGTGVLAACVPGAFGGWLLLLEQFGTWRLEDVLSFAIGYADEGFPFVAGIRATIERTEDLLREWPGTRELYLPPPEVGALFRNPALAATYRRILDEARGGSREEEIEKAQARVLRGLRRRGDRPLRRRRRAAF